MEKGVLKNSQENTCARVSILIKLFSWEFRKISKNTFFTEHLRATASKMSQYLYC